MKKYGSSLEFFVLLLSSPVPVNEPVNFHGYLPKLITGCPYKDAKAASPQGDPQVEPLQRGL